MLYLKRKIDAFLAEWKANPDRKPLIVKGPRQVGKTESIKRFGEMNYRSVIIINFVEEPKYKMITADGYKAEDIIKNISRMDPSKRFIKGETLIFFDELQEFPEIATALKFFKIDGRFDVICSGSMLGINYRKIESNSVGYKTDYEMFSLDFEEFLWAKGPFVSPRPAEDVPAGCRSSAAAETAYFLTESGCESVGNIPTFSSGISYKKIFTTFCHQKAAPKVSAGHLRRDRTAVLPERARKIYAVCAHPIRALEPPFDLFLPPVQCGGCCALRATMIIRLRPYMAGPRPARSHCFRYFSRCLIFWCF